MRKVKYTGDTFIHGATGIARKAVGHDDPQSTEFEAWIFTPDNWKELGLGEFEGYYVSDDFLEDIE